jgi:hypothetical protein
MSLVEIRVDPTSDPDGRKLLGLLSTIHRIEKLEAIHWLSVHALAGLGALLWVAVALPKQLPGGAERFVILAFAGTAIGLLVTVGFERHLRRIEKRYLDSGRQMRPVWSAPSAAASVSDSLSPRASPAHPERP